MKKLLFILILLTAIITGCSSSKKVTEVPVPIVNTNTEYVYKYIKDSVFVHDSVDRFIKGDTVLIYKYKYLYRTLNNTDTVTKYDSIQVPVKVTTTETVEVNKLKWYQSILMWLGVIFFCYVVFIIGKFFKK